MSMDIKFGCASCSKENGVTVPIARILEKLDELFSRNDLAAVGRLLEYWENEARILNDERGLLEILNEEIGYFRRTGDQERGLLAVEEAFALIEKLELFDNESAGTLYLNGATTMKAFGKTKEALEYYGKAKKIYESTIAPNDYKMAAFYNNVSSAYKELGDTEAAEQACFDAIAILEQSDRYNGEIAVTHVNLAHLYYDRDSFDERVYEHMEKAWELLSSSNNVHDGNFAFLCSKCYPSFAYFGYIEYEKKLKEMTEKIYERT